MSAIALNAAKKASVIVYFPNPSGPRYCASNLIPYKAIPIERTFVVLLTKTLYVIFFAIIYQNYNYINKTTFLYFH